MRLCGAGDGSATHRVDTLRPHRGHDGAARPEPRRPARDRGLLDAYVAHKRLKPTVKNLRRALQPVWRAVVLAGERVGAERRARGRSQDWSRWEYVCQRYSQPVSANCLQMGHFAGDWAGRVILRCCWFCGAPQVWYSRCLSWWGGVAPHLTGVTRASSISGSYLQASRSSTHYPFPHTRSLVPWHTFNKSWIDAGNLVLQSSCSRETGAAAR
jgi:hypothetical protein